jgi:hypothetical protein
MALGGWLSAACRGVCPSSGWFLPDLKQERGLQSGAKEIAGARSKARSRNEID